MRKDVVLGVADAIEKAELAKVDVGFNMATFCDAADYILTDNTKHECGTVACIAGWVVMLYDERGKRRGTPNPSAADVQFVGDKAQQTMGLPDQSLFYPGEPYYGSLSDISPDHAVKVLRHLAETGEVNWEFAEPSSRGLL